MKKGQVYEGNIVKVAFPNKCHIQVDGKTDVVKKGVPGQKVRFSVNKVRSGKAEGRILEVLEKSSLEGEPICPHFADCGGCTYQDLPYEAEQWHRLAMNMSLRGSRKVPVITITGTRWSSPSEMK